MFKIPSHVQRLLLCLIIFAGPHLFAAEGTSVNTTNNSATNVETAREQNRGAAIENAKNACNSATSAFNSAVREFSTACSAGGGLLQPANDEKDRTGELACSGAVKCCLERDADDCNNADSTVLGSEIKEADSILEQFEEALSEVDEDSIDFKNLMKQKNKMNGLQSRRKLYAKCPMLGAVGIDKSYEEAEEAREKLEEKEDAVSELQQQINEAQADLDKDKLKIKNEMEKLELTTQEKLEEIKSEQDEAVKRLLEKIEAQQNQIRELQNNIAQLEMGKADAADALNNKITELKVGCYDQALEKAQRTRARVVERAANNEYSAESLTTLYKSVGSSTLEDTQKLVEYQRKLCENDYRFKESVKLAFRSYERATGVADRSIGQMNESIGLIRIAIAKAQNSERLETFQEAMKKIELLQKAYQSGLESLQQQYVNLVTSSSRQIAELQQQLARKNAHLEEAQTYLTYKNSILSLQKTSTGGDLSITKDEWGKIIGGYNDLPILAAEVNIKCKCGGGAPQVARNFLEKHLNRTVANCPNSWSEAAEVEGTK